MVLDAAFSAMVDREHAVPCMVVPRQRTPGGVYVVVHNIDARKDRVPCHHRFPVLTVDFRDHRLPLVFSVTETSHNSAPFPMMVCHF